MYQLPRVRKNHSRHMAGTKPTYADVLCGLLDDPYIGRLLLEPDLATCRHLRRPCVAPSMKNRGRPGPRAAREALSRRMVIWLECNDPLFAPTIGMLFDMTESWPKKAEKAFWRVVEEDVLELLEIYAAIREIAEGVLLGDAVEIPCAASSGKPGHHAGGMEQDHVCAQAYGTAYRRPYAGE